MRTSRKVSSSTSEFAGARKWGSALRSFWRADDGSALLEFTIVFGGILMPLSLAILLFGQVFYHQQIAQSALRDAVRFLTRVEDQAGASGALTKAGADARKLATTGTTDGSGADRIPGWTPNDITCAVVTVVINSRDIDTIRCTTSLDFGNIGVVTAIGLENALVLTVSNQQRYIGE